MQSRRMSITEAAVSTLIGLAVSFAGNMFIFWALGKQVSLPENVIMVAFFTGVSFVRGYWVRRLFNWLESKEDEHSQHGGIGA